MNDKKILVGISGGIDSSYTVSLLKDSGYDVTAIYLMISDDNYYEAEKIANELNVPFVLADCRSLFQKTVVENFINEYSAGKTPNPCVICNRYVKIEKLIKYAKDNGFSKVATGHYAKIKYNSSADRYEIYAADDKKKDQSYMLWRLNQEQLSMLICPLAQVSKNEVREKAKELNLSNADKKDSLDICFIPNGKYTDFLEKSGIKSESGNFTDKNKKILGTHKGIINYTIGQRKGLGISNSFPLYVTDIIPKTNTVCLGPEEDLFNDRFSVSNINYVSIEKAENIKLYVKIRYAATPVECKISKLNDDSYEVHTSISCRAITRGQSAVFYDENQRLIFGGYID